MLTRIKERAEEAPLRSEVLRESEANFRTLAETIASAIFISRGKNLHYVNHAAEVITGYTREELLSMSFCDLLHPDTREPVINRGRLHQEEIGLASRCEVRILTKNHEERWLEVTAATIDFDGVLGKLLSAYDLTERKRAEEQAQLLAVTDPLTGLGNYRRLLDVLHAEIERSGRTGRPFAVLLLDVDGLKTINDRYGHLAGSRALCRLGDVLRISCRAIDTAARYGGDEFAVILPETTVRAAGMVASRIHKRLATDSQQPPFSASIGVAAYPQDGETVEALLEIADRELYGMKIRAADRPSPSVLGHWIPQGGPTQENGSSKWGGVMELQMRIKSETQVIEEAEFKTTGCSSAIASSLLATEWVKGKTSRKHWPSRTRISAARSVFPRATLLDATKFSRIGGRLHLVGDPVF
jgi:diguanylate cyclase (GGDEF)-like protein/PAS domain S-box-containing protein